MINLDGNNILLEFGKIEMQLTEGSWCDHSTARVSWFVDYERKDLEYYKYDEVETLQEAYSQYYKWYNEVIESK